MKKLRILHLYLGCFFSPLLLLYVGTGWYQTFNVNRNKGPGEQLDWIGRLRSVHVDQILPKEGVASYSTSMFRYLVAIMSLALIVTVVLGIVLAFRSSRGRWPVFLCLVFGVLVPVVLLLLGQKH